MISLNGNTQRKKRSIIYIATIIAAEESNIEEDLNQSIRHCACMQLIIDFAKGNKTFDKIKDTLSPRLPFFPIFIREFYSPVKLTCGSEAQLIKNNTAVFKVIITHKVKFA